MRALSDYKVMQKSNLLKNTELRNINIKTPFAIQMILRGQSENGTQFNIRLRALVFYEQIVKEAQQITNISFLLQVSERQPIPL